MKIRNGFVSNSSSSSFIIPKGNDTGNILEYAKKESEKVFLKRASDDVRYYLTKEHHNFGYNRRIEDAKRTLNFNEHRIDSLDADIRITTVAKLMDEDFEEGFYIPDWYDNYEKFDKDDIVLYDIYDNVIPEEAGQKIVKKFKTKDYNLHMG